MTLRFSVPLARKGVELERSQSLAEEAQEATNALQESVMMAALEARMPTPGACACFQCQARDRRESQTDPPHLIRIVLYAGSGRQDGLYRPQTVGECGCIIRHVSRGLVKAGAIESTPAGNVPRTLEAHVAIRERDEQGERIEIEVTSA